MPEKHETTLFIEVVKILIGTVVLVASAAGSFILAEKATTSLRALCLNDWLCIGGAGFVLALCYMVITAIFLFLLEVPIATLLTRSVGSFNVIIKRMKHVFIEENGCEELGLSGLIKDAEKVLNEKKNILNIDKIVIAGNYDQLQERFLEKAELDDNKMMELYIVGTMLGTYSTDGTNLAQYIHEKIKQSGHTPFSKAYFCSPGHRIIQNRKTNQHNHRRSLYPLSARIVAGEILINIHDAYKEINKELVNDVVIGLSFVDKVDIFPAIQLWQNSAAMILCSTGTVDRKGNDGNNSECSSIAKAMPVALMLTGKKYSLIGSDKQFNLSHTLQRLETHIKHDYNINDETVENWKLFSVDQHNQLKVNISNYIKLEEEEEYLTMIKESDAFKNQYNFVKEAFELLSNPGNIEIEKFRKIINQLKSITCSFSGSALNESR